VGVQHSNIFWCILLLPYPHVLFAEWSMWAMSMFCIGTIEHAVVRHTFRQV
jgi:hypothetical protein